MLRMREEVYMPNKQFFMRSAILLVAFALIGSIPAVAKRVHMKTTGSDAAGDGTLENPYFTLGKCMHALIPVDWDSAGTSDTIIVHGGTYGQQTGAGTDYSVAFNYGENACAFRGINSARPAYIMGNPADVAIGNKPVFTTSTAGQYVMQFNCRREAGGGWEVSYPMPNGWHPQYIVIKNLSFGPFTLAAIYIADGGTYCRTTPTHNITIDSCDFYGGPNGERHALKITGLDSMVLKNCTFRNMVQNGVDGVGVHYAHAYNNDFTDCGNAGFSNKGGSSYNLIEKNIFHDTNYGVLIGQQTDMDQFRPPFGTLDADGDTMFYEAKDIEVYRNLFMNVYEPIKWDCAHGGKVNNNTFYSPNNYGTAPPAYGIKYIAEIHQNRYHDGTSNPSWTRSTYSHDGEFKNNICVFGRTYNNNGPINVQTAYTIPESFTFANNLWYCTDPTARVLPNWEGLTGDPPQHSNDYTGDAKFIRENPSIPTDFLISEDSPARGVGLVLPRVILDFLDRPYRDPGRALGAFEAQLSGAPPIAPTRMELWPR